MSSVFKRLYTPALWLVILLLTAKLTALLIEAWLPPLPHTECLSKNEWPERRYPFARAFGLTAATHSKPTAPSHKSLPAVNLRGYTLTMTAVGHPSMAIIQHRRKSYLLKEGETFEGFRLRKVYNDHVELTKSGRTYTLSMEKKSRPTIDLHTPKAQKTVQESQIDQIRREGDTVYIPRELVNAFKDPKKIFRYIAIDPLYRDRKLKGFIVVDVKKGSVFDRMGLRKRDIILAVDGKPLHDEKAVFAYFNRIDTLDALSLTIERHKEKKELHYEIY